MQNIIVAVIVVLAIWYLARTLFGKKPSQDACGCGCRGCAASASCTGMPRNLDRCFNEDVVCAGVDDTGRVS